MPENPFKQAIKELHEHGWIKGRLHDNDTGVVCVLGALAFADFGKDALVSQGEFRHCKDPLFEHMRFLDEVAQEVDHTVGHAWQYNDWRAHTIDDVEVLLQVAADKWDTTHA